MLGLSLLHLLYSDVIIIYTTLSKILDFRLSTYERRTAGALHYNLLPQCYHVAQDPLCNTNITVRNTHTHTQTRRIYRGTLAE